MPFTVSAMLANPAHARIYLFESFGTRIAVVSTRILQVVVTITVPQGLHTDIGIGWFSISPSGNRIYVTDANADGVSVISTSSNSVVAFVPFPLYVVGVTVADFGQRVYVSSPNANTISVVDPTSDQVVRTLSMGLCPKPGVNEKCEITDLTTSPDGRYVIGASGRTDSIVAIDSVTNKKIDQTRLFGLKCPSDGFNGINAAASQVSLFI
ncbi:MAG TPA: YncE family protein [Candidatus Eremiobacteraceae bacterium]|nr:YncE family protein [Candidatus Eremiobacteraceae bacterium]